MSNQRRDINIYKANGKKTGAAAQFKMSHKDDCMFLECAAQIGDKDSSRPYDWNNKIIVKLGETDISKLLVYLGLNKPSSPMKLFHESPGGGSKTIELKYQEYKSRPGYYLSVGHQKKKGDKPHRVSLPIGIDEAMLIKLGLELGFQIMLGWHKPARLWKQKEDEK